MAHTHNIGADTLKLPDLAKIVEDGTQLTLSDKATILIADCRKYLDKKIANGSEPIYGINTGFGDLHEVSIPKEELATLQHNLLISHACGIGDEVPTDIVRLMLFLKIQSLSYFTVFSSISIHQPGLSRINIKHIQH